MKPEDRVKQQVKKIFDMRNISEMSRRTGYPKQTLRTWRDNPLRIKAVDLFRLEEKTGVNV